METRVPYLDLPGQYRASKDEILSAVDRVLERGDYILGEELTAFEKAFADYCGVRHAIGVANGTDAILLALKALGIGPGDEVITVPNSFIATVSPIVFVGATPVFVDIGDDMLMDFQLLEKVLTPRTKAIIPVHLTGRCVPMGPLLELAKRRHLWIVEDAAQAVGAHDGQHKAGAAGHIGCFSLHPLKNLNAAGDGGMITTHDEALAAKIRLLHNHGLQNRDEAAFWGHNSRLDTLQAAILNCRLPRLDAVIQRRREIAALYQQHLSSKVICPQESPQERHTYHVFIVQAERRDALKAHLAQRGVETKIHYPVPIHLQPAAAALGYKRGDFPVCERLADRILSLPIHAGLTDEQVAWVCDAINDFYR